MAEDLTRDDLVYLEATFRRRSQSMYDDYIAGGRRTHSTCGHGDAYLAAADVVQTMLTKPRSAWWWIRPADRPASVEQSPKTAPPTTTSAERAAWSDFQRAGLLWWVNQLLHTFGWAIVFEVKQEDAEPTHVYPARVKYRGFDVATSNEGITKLTHHMVAERDRLLKDVE